MSNWSTEWPTKPGQYWFYGWPYGDYEFFGKWNDPGWCRVTVRKVNGGNMVVRDGHFWDESEGFIGMFQPITLPDLPVCPLLKRNKT